MYYFIDIETCAINTTRWASSVWSFHLYIQHDCTFLAISASIQISLVATAFLQCLCHGKFLISFLSNAITIVNNLLAILSKTTKIISFVITELLSHWPTIDCVLWPGFGQTSYMDIGKEGIPILFYKQTHIIAYIT